MQVNDWYHYFRWNNSSFHFFSRTVVVSTLFQFHFILCNSPKNISRSSCSEFRQWWCTKICFFQLWLCLAAKRKRNLEGPELWVFIAVFISKLGKKTHSYNLSKCGSVKKFRTVVNRLDMLSWKFEEEKNKLGSEYDMCWQYGIGGSVENVVKTTKTEKIWITLFNITVLTKIKIRWALTVMLLHSHVPIMRFHTRLQSDETSFFWRLQFWNINHSH